LTDLETSINSPRLAWIRRLFTEGASPWKAFVNQLLENFGGIFLFRCSYDINDFDVKGPVIRATFLCNLSRNNVAVAS